jgi:predicted phosphohydrolase
LWYEYVRVGTWVNQFDVFCGVVVNGVRLYQPHCRSVEDCVEEIYRDYRREVERLKEPPEPALVIKIRPRGGASEGVAGAASLRRGVG